MSSEQRKGWDFSDWRDKTLHEVIPAYVAYELAQDALKEILAEAGVGVEPYSTVSEEIANDWAEHIGLR